MLIDTIKALNYSKIFENLYLSISYQFIGLIDSRIAVYRYDRYGTEERIELDDRQFFHRMVSDIPFMGRHENSFSGDNIDTPTYPLIDGPGGSQRHFLEVGSAQWRIVLAEFVHLLGLFLRHASQTKSARATAVLFDQMLRHLMILERMPGHDGSLVVLKKTDLSSGSGVNGGYRILFGELTVHDDRNPFASGTPLVSKRITLLNSGLEQAFEWMAQHRIDCLYIELPGGSNEKTDQLRLSLNIVARYQPAVMNETSITFRYAGRALTVPLIRDSLGNPDPNLTLVAGLNSLTTMNTRALIKQAEAYCQMEARQRADGAKTAVPAGSYNQIFNVRSLRAQIIRPPVEVNNLGAIDAKRRSKRKTLFEHASNDQTSDQTTDDCIAAGSLDDLMRPITVPYNTLRQITQVERSFFADWIDVDDPQYETALHAILSDNYVDLNTTDIGRRLAAVSSLIYAVEKKCQDPAVIDRLLFVLQDRLMLAAEGVLANIHVQNQGLRLISNGRVVIAGLMHQRLIDLVSLVKDKVVTKKKFDIIRSLGFDFNPGDFHAVARFFNLPPNNVQYLMDLLKSCFDTGGGFRREVFESSIHRMAPQADTLFEMLWCFLKLTPRRKDRLAFVNAIPVLMTHLKDPDRALRFILDDLCQDIFQIDFSDRNALVLANILLRTENRELYIDLQRTPEHVLDQSSDETSAAKRYVVWRLNTDNIRIVTKFKTIHMALAASLKAAIEEEAEPQETQFLFSLERETLIFMSLAGSMAARGYLHHALLQYGDSSADIYQNVYIGHYLSQLINHLRIVIRGLGCLGEVDDIAVLMVLKSHVEPLSAMANHPAQALAVRRAFKWVDSSIKAIQMRNQMADTTK